MVAKSGAYGIQNSAMPSSYSVYTADQLVTTSPRGSAHPVDEVGRRLASSANQAISHAPAVDPWRAPRRGKALAGRSTGRTAGTRPAP